VAIRVWVGGCDGPRWTTTLSASAVRSRCGGTGELTSMASPGAVLDQRLLTLDRAALAQRMADEALVEQDRAQIIVARELDAVHVVHFALHVARGTVVPGERRHDRPLGRHAHLEPNALVVAVAVEVIDDVEARRALRVVDRGDIEEQRKVEAVAQP